MFALFAAFLLAYFAWNTRRLITEQIVATVDAEIAGLSDLYQQGGIRRLIFAIDDRGSRPGSSLYLLTTAAGEGVTGNIGSLTTGILDKSGWTETAYRRIDDRTARPSITRWCACFSFRAASACWSAAISRSASGCTTSSSAPAAGRSRSWSCSASPAGSSSRAACSSASTR